MRIPRGILTLALAHKKNAMEQDCRGLAGARGAPAVSIRLEVGKFRMKVRLSSSASASEARSDGWGIPAAEGPAMLALCRVCRDRVPFSRGFYGDPLPGKTFEHPTRCCTPTLHFGRSNRQSQATSRPRSWLSSLSQRRHKGRSQRAVYAEDPCRTGFCGMVGREDQWMDRALHALEPIPLSALNNFRTDASLRADYVVVSWLAAARWNASLDSTEFARMAVERCEHKSFACFGALNGAAIASFDKRLSPAHPRF